MAVNGKSNFDGTFTAVTQHGGKVLAVDALPFFDGNSLAIDGNSNLDGKSPLYRDRPPVRYFYVGKFTEHLPDFFSNGQNRVHPEARCPKPGTPFHASPRAPSYWPTPAQTRFWPNLKRVHPILATHPPIGYPISITPTRLWPGYSTSSPHAHASSRHRGTRRVIFAVDVVVRAAEL